MTFKDITKEEIDMSLFPSYHRKHGITIDGSIHKYKEKLKRRKKNKNLKTHRK